MNTEKTLVRYFLNSKSAITGACSGALKRLVNPSGDTNIILVALVLPLLLLVVFGAVDIIRLPLARQQLDASLHTGFDALILDAGDAAGFPEPASGRNWCFFVDSEHDMDACSGSEVEKEITRTALEKALDLVYDDLTAGTGFFSHSGSDLHIEGGVYIFTTTKGGGSDGEIASVSELVTSNLNTTATLADVPTTPLLDSLKAKYENDAGTVLGHWSTPADSSDTDSMDIPVIAIYAAARVNHYFPLPAVFRGEMGGATPTTTVKEAYLVRPLARSIRLSGPAAANPLTVVTTTTAAPTTTTTHGGSTFTETTSSSSTSTSTSSSSSCFPAGVKVYMADGSEVNIEEVEIGDEVIGVNRYTLEVETNTVTKTYTHPHTEGYWMVETEFGETLDITRNHPVFSEGAYTRIENLGIGSPLTLVHEGELVESAITAITLVDVPITTYNLDVENVHSFVADGYLVHNGLDDPMGSKSHK